MSTARELAQKIRQAQIENDYEFHAGIALWNRISYGVIVILLGMLIISLITSVLAWAVVGFLLSLGNMCLLYWVRKRLNEHQCTLPKETNGRL